MNPAGSRSVTATPLAAFSELGLVTVRVKTTASPTSSEARSAVLARAKSVWITRSITVAVTGTVWRALAATAVLVMAIRASGSSTSTWNVACRRWPGTRVQLVARSGGSPVSPRAVYVIRTAPLAPLPPLRSVVVLALPPDPPPP